MKRELLPIGSVVMLDGGNTPLMVTGYRMKEKVEDEKIYDYVGCVFPEGFMEQIYSLFDQNQIKETLFVGFEDEESKKYTYDVANGLTDASILGAPEGPNGGNNMVRRRVKRKAPAIARSPKEVLARYTKEVISGGETEKVDFSTINDVSDIKDIL